MKNSDKLKAKANGKGFRTPAKRTKAEVNKITEALEKEKARTDAFSKAYDAICAKYDLRFGAGLYMIAEQGNRILPRLVVIDANENSTKREERAKGFAKDMKALEIEHEFILSAVNEVDPDGRVFQRIKLTSTKAKVDEGFKVLEKPPETESKETPETPSDA